MGYLTLLGHLVSDKFRLESEVNSQPRLYTVFLGESADTRKSTSIAKPVDLFKEVLDPRDLNLLLGVGSAEGLSKALQNNRRLILVLDELKALTQKMRIDGSVLLPCVNSLFENKAFENLTKNHEIRIDNAELCLLGASTLETYQNMFSRQFQDIGFLNRLFIVIGEGQRQFALPQTMPPAEREALITDLQEIIKFVKDRSQSDHYALPVDSAARQLFEDWYLGLEHSLYAKRLDTYGHRLMVLLAVNERQETISEDIVERTLALLDYQLAARKYSAPIDADNAMAKLEAKIRRKLASGPVSKRELERACHKDRAGNHYWNLAIGNLTKSGELVYDAKTNLYYLRDREK